VEKEDAQAAKEWKMDSGGDGRLCESDRDGEVTMGFIDGDWQEGEKT
jgi:hypothetical protein